MEIPPSSSEGYGPSLYDTYSEGLSVDSERPLGERIGEKASIFFSIIASFAFTASVAKKKRAYAPIQTPTTIVPLPSESTPPEEEKIPIQTAPQPNSPPTSPSYKPLPGCKEEERRIVEELFQTISRTRALLLPFSALYLTKLGNQIEHIHPFAFISAAPPEDLKTIFIEGNILKVEGVMTGIIRGMKREFQKNNLEPFIPSFASHFKKEIKPIRQLILNQSWRALVDYLFDIPV